MMLSSRMPELSAFEVLLGIARTGSLGATGRDLGLTQQAVSARIASLEAQTGVPLVTRTPRGSQLTATGVAVAEWAAKLLAVATQVDTALASLREESRARVKVAASQTIAEQLMPRWLVSLQAAAARLGTSAATVVLTATNSEHAAEAVQDGSADVGFIESPLAPKGLRSKVVAHDQLVVVVAPDHKWAKLTRPVNPIELTQTPLVAREAGSGTRDSLTAALRTALGTVDQAAPALELSSAAAVRAAVRAGAGPAVMSALAVGDDLAMGRLRAVAVCDIDLHRDLRAIWRGARVPPAGAVRDLLSHIVGFRGSR
ncbi:LysR family transcriptional regulator [Mycobacteroides chelonae]|uniref:LysR family transcriptional regulator n=1 Tax=Mycobacteroides chelonae TaxID=1774 RepID=UPI0008A9FC78|nr:LysR family transcriptional regulator [Mycobacteroides chelonae]OHU53683.1 LysR family transcriptional regulator [Mycobacteroides chelonae]